MFFIIYNTFSFLYYFITQFFWQKLLIFLHDNTTIHQHREVLVFATINLSFIKDKINYF